MRRRYLSVAALVAAIVLVPAIGAAAEGAQQQIEFGAEMARRGLWKEALFRFQQAAGLEPDNPRILNNVAVAYEALGLFEKALETYQRALEIDRQDDTLKSNYARFLEFYQNFRPREETEEVAAEVGGTAATGDGGVVR